jgi:hypothetical protein
MMQRRAYRSKYNLNICCVSLRVDRSIVSVLQRTKATDIHRIEVIADRPRQYSLSVAFRVGVLAQLMVMFRVLWRDPGSERHDNAGVVEPTSSTNDNAGMFTNELRGKCIAREVDPEILPDARCAVNLPIAVVPLDPSSGFELGIRREWACTWEVRHLRGFFVCLRLYALAHIFGSELDGTGEQSVVCPFC